MINFSLKGRVLVTCAKGLSPFLTAELRTLGFNVLTSHETGAVVEASMHDAMKLNLSLRTAYNVLYLVKEFSCIIPEEMYKKIRAIPWEDIIPVNEYICVVSRVDNPYIKNTMFANQKVKDAIVDRIYRERGKRPDAGPKKDNVVITLYWTRDRAWIYINTSGVKLSDRNYRKIPHKAPMQEALAAGVILAAGYDGSGHFVNPMCGSGTLAIEAALIALNRYPAFLRTNFGFMHIIGYDKNKWQDLRKTAHDAQKKHAGIKILASDIDSRAVEAAKKNAMTAGVDHAIEFRVCDFADTPVPEGPGTVIVNPPYGERMGEIEELEDVYEKLGDFFKQKCGGYNAFIFTGNLPLGKKVGLRTSAKIQFFNGDIECRLLKYEMYEGSKK